MKLKVGLWIDHRRAVITTVADGVEETVEILSHVERQPGRHDGIRSTASFESQRAPADDSCESRFTVHLNNYYAEVIDAIRGAESILIFGPGEAKGELKGRLENAKLEGRITAVENADKMTERQIAAKIREFFRQLDGMEAP